jgi:hypothetical protein
LTTWSVRKVAKTGTDGYRPYNIERTVANAGEPEKLRITPAGAGFSEDQIEVMVEEEPTRHPWPPTRGQDAGIPASRHRRAGVSARLSPRGRDGSFER